MNDPYVTKGACYGARCVLAGLRSADWSSLHPLWAKAQYQGFRTFRSLRRGCGVQG